MNHVRSIRRAGLVSLVAIGCLDCVLAWGAETWEMELASMPLVSAPAELNRTNCVSTLLPSFRGGQTTKALIFMPGATDELYLFRRVKVALTNDHPTVLDALRAMSGQSHIRVTFHDPLVLLHTDEDPLEPMNRLEDAKTARRLETEVHVRRLSCDDWDWDALQPVLKRSLKLSLRPWRYSRDSWHFYRHSLVACNLNGLELLQAVAMAGKSRFILGRHEAVFEVDPRALIPPRFDAHLH